MTGNGEKSNEIQLPVTMAKYGKINKTEEHRIILYRKHVRYNLILISATEKMVVCPFY